jgi:hypothetical protein
MRLVTGILGGREESCVQKGDFLVVRLEKKTVKKRDV